MVCRVYLIFTSTKLQGNVLLARVCVNGDDLGTLLGSCTLEDGQTDTADTENGDV